MFGLIEDFCKHKGIIIPLINDIIFNLSKDVVLVVPVCALASTWGEVRVNEQEPSLLVLDPIFQVYQNSTFCMLWS